jgi:hypothetical protein
MSTTFGRVLNKLANYKTRPGWYTKVIKNLGQDLADLFKASSRVTAGGLATVGTVNATDFGVSVTALDATLNGTLKLQLALLADVDLFTTAAGPPAIGQAVFSDGSDASGISLAGGETAQVALIAADSDGAGGATGEDGAMMYLAVVAGTATTYNDATSPPSDTDIESALTGSTGVHDGTAGWVRLADLDWIEAGGSTVTPNRDA